MPSNILKNIKFQAGAVSKWHIDIVVPGSLFTVMLFTSKSVKREGKLDQLHFI
jgi:hypothetical protein